LVSPVRIVVAFVLVAHVAAHAEVFLVFLSFSPCIVCGPTFAAANCVVCVLYLTESFRVSASVGVVKFHQVAVHGDDL
jgi:hypothetical protein